MLKYRRMRIYRRLRMVVGFLSVISMCVVMPGLSAAPIPKRIIRIGHFPTITHAQAVIAHGMSRQGDGWFERRLGPDVNIEWYVYKAGPSAMEALLTGVIDLAFVGPNPAINAHLRSGGKEVRIVAGACSGGAALLVGRDAGIVTDLDFKGKRVATPQLGNTQDVAMRSWLRAKGFAVTVAGGDVTVLPTSNADLLTLFQGKQIDAAWTVEPWVSLLESKIGAKIYLQESALWKDTGGRYVTTQLVSSVRFLESDADLLGKFVAAHIELTDWTKRDPRSAKKYFNAEIEYETGRAMPVAILDKAWERIELTYDPVSASLARSAKSAYEIGFLKRAADLSRIYEFGLLNAALRSQGRGEVR